MEGLNHYWPDELRSTVKMLRDDSMGISSSFILDSVQVRIYISIWVSNTTLTYTTCILEYHAIQRQLLPAWSWQRGLLTKDGPLDQHARFFWAERRETFYLKAHLYCLSYCITFSNPTGSDNRRRSAQTSMYIPYSVQNQSTGRQNNNKSRY